MSKKRISFIKVKPGMVIKGLHHYGLVVYIKPPHKIDLFWGGAPYVDMFDTNDAYTGRGSSEYNPKEKVQVITGKKRKRILSDILRAQRKRQTDAYADEKLVCILKRLTD